ncbi:uncharacterized protein [Cicer arietinum]|uniref:Uncharacterized protein LOC101506226 n=1 Tax=Cicer arietinum TaxID=3827 RepID=A0A1S2YLQ2_CICAR|nr:uncharacterized protein LOC101506226 [Cicer arietinum]
MTVDDDDRWFVEWKEQFVSQERGHRVVHYYLKDSAGESILAVVGTERSIRHMCYVVAEEFLEVFGMECSIPPGFKWRSRREVVDWLTSMLSKQHVRGDRSVWPAHNLAIVHEITNGSINEVAQMVDDKDIPKSNSKLSNSDIVWSGLAWTCSKQLKHYPAFCRNGIQIGIQSFVFVMGNGESHYVAYLEDMYEDRRGQKKVKVRWFHHNQEVKGVIPVRNPHPREVFITPYSQVISTECVDGPATVLTREHYEKCTPYFSPASTDRIHLCFRQLKGNKVKPFDLSKLRGYYAQPVLSSLHDDTVHITESLSNSLTGEDDDINAGDDPKRGTKRSRSVKGSPQFCNGRQGVRKLIRNKQMMGYQTFQVVNYARPNRRLLSVKPVECQHWYNSTYKVDDKIELLSQDSGIRGCWFRCTIVQVARKQLKVQYDDVQDEDGSGNLEEWIPAIKLAKPDKLGMRQPGRSTIRPAPPHEEQEVIAEVGTAVDAWWSDGWWEGVVTSINNCGDDCVQVYFPGESLLMTVHKKDLRISRDWLGEKWINIKAKPDIIPTINTTNSFNTKQTMSLSKAEDVDGVNFANSCHEVPADEKSNEPDIAEYNIPPSEESTQVDDFEDNDGNNIVKDNNENGDNKNDSSRDVEVIGTSGLDCKVVELMEVVV